VVAPLIVSGHKLVATPKAEEANELSEAVGTNLPAARTVEKALTSPPAEKLAANPLPAATAEPIVRGSSVEPATRQVLSTPPTAAPVSVQKVFARELSSSNGAAM